MLVFSLLVQMSITSLLLSADLETDTNLARELAHEARELCGINCGSIAEFGAIFSKTGDLKESKESFTEAWRAAAKLQNETERRIILDEIATLQSQAGQIHDAIKAAQSLPSHNEQAMVLSTIAIAQARSQTIDAALKTVDLISPVEKRQKTYTLVQIAMYLSSQKDFHNALRILKVNPEDVEIVSEVISENIPSEQLNQQEQSIVTRLSLKSVGLISVAQDIAKSGELNTALKIVHSIPLKRQRDIGLLRIANIAAGSGDLKFAQEVIKEIRVKEHKEIALGRLITKMANQGELKNALALTETIKDRNVKVDALYDIATSLAEKGDTKTTLSLFNNASSLNNTDNVARNTAATNIVSAYLKSSHLTLAEAFTLKINDPEMLSKSYQAIAVTKWQNMLTEDAEKIFKKSRQTALKIKDPYQKSTRLRELAIAQFNIGDSKGSLTTIGSAFMATKMIEIGAGTDVIALTELATTQKVIGDDDGAAVSFKHARINALHYPEKPYVADLLQSITFAQAYAGDIEPAVRSARQEKSELNRSHMLLGIANALLTPKNKIH